MTKWQQTCHNAMPHQHVTKPCHTNKHVTTPCHTNKHVTTPCHTNKRDNAMPHQHTCDNAMPHLHTCDNAMPHQQTCDNAMPHQHTCDNAMPHQHPRLKFIIISCVLAWLWKWAIEEQVFGCVKDSSWARWWMRLGQCVSLWGIIKRKVTGYCCKPKLNYKLPLIPLPL